MITINIKFPNGQVETRHFDKESVTVGRGVGNDLMIEDGGISRYHLRITVLNGVVIVNDLNSSNGTYFNEEKITTAVVKPNDEIALGETVLRFWLTSAGSAKPTPEDPRAAAKKSRHPSGQQQELSTNSRATAQEQEYDERPRRPPRIASRETQLFTTDDIFAELQLFRENPNAAIRQLEYNHQARKTSGAVFSSASWRPIQNFLEPLFKFLRDPSIQRIMLNAPNQIYVQSESGIHLTDITLTPEQFIHTLETLSSVDEEFQNGSRPYFRATLDDGSQILGSIPPFPCKDGCMVITCNHTPALSPVDLVVNGTMSEAILFFLHACIVLRKTLIVTGPPSSGTSTFVGAMASLIPDPQRVVIVEGSSHLPARHTNTIILDAVACGESQEKLNSLLQFGLQIHPQRIVIPDYLPGSLRSFVDAASGSAPGSIAAIEAATAEAALFRLESHALLTKPEENSDALRGLIRHSVQIVVEMCLLPDGSRRIARVCEVAPVPDGSLPVIRDIFKMNTEQNSFGTFSDQPIWMPTFLGQLKAAGLMEALEIFTDSEEDQDEEPDPPSYTRVPR